MMKFHTRGRHFALAAKLCIAAVAAASLIVVPLLAIAQNQEVTDTTEILLPDGRTLAEWLLEADALLNTGQYARALVESRMRTRELGNVPAVLEVQEQALSNLRAEVLKPDRWTPWPGYTDGGPSAQAHQADRGGGWKETVAASEEGESELDNR